MSLGVVIKGAEGVVLASDSRVTLSAEKQGSAPLTVNFDNATKLLSFSEPHNYVAAVTYGAAVVGLRTAHSFIPEFEVELEAEKRLPVLAYAEKLSQFFLSQWKQVMPDDYSGPSIMFIIGGFDPGDAYGKVFLIEVPENPDPVQQNPSKTDFGMTWGGQLQIASRVIHGFDPQLPELLRVDLGLTDVQIGQLLLKLRTKLAFSIPYQVLPLQDCVNLATFMVRTTMDAQNLAIGVRGVGGPIDVAVITRTKGLHHIQRKKLRINMLRTGEDMR